MKKLIKDNLILLIIVVMASVLRLYQLGSFPSALKWDEAALGYNAYSVLKTAKDEYGQFLPVVFKSFGDYKPGLYIYMDVPFVFILGLTEFATRFPSAAAGILAVLFTYLLVKEWFGKKAALCSAFVLSISPWHIEFSRGAWEANLAIFLIILGIYFFIISSKNKKYLFCSALFFGLTLITYQGAKVFTPLILIGVILIYKDQIQRIPRSYVLKTTIIFAVFILLIAISMLKGEGGRAGVMSILSYPRSSSEIQEITNQDGGDKNSLTFQIFHPEVLYFFQGIAERYFNHFSGKFLFFEGDWSNKRLGVPYQGVMYFIEIVLLPIGLYFLILNKNEQTKKLLFYWLLISPIPAAITRDSISAVRALNMAIPLNMITGLGLYQLLIAFQNKKRIARIGLYLLISIFYFFSVVYFLDQYYIHAPIANSATSQDGYREVVQFVKPISSQYQKIIFTQYYGQPYIYWLFYTQYDPVKYQQRALLTQTSQDVGSVEKIDNLSFRNFHWLSDIEIGDLYIGDDLSLLTDRVKQVNNAKTLKEIYFQDGRLAFRIVEKK